MSGRVESNWEQWYHPGLQQWVHYVPVSADLRDLEMRVEWCRQHDTQARQIAAAASSYMRSLSYDSIIRQTGGMLHALFQCQRG